MSANPNSSRGLSALLALVAGLMCFAIVSWLLQLSYGGKPADPSVKERLEKKETVAKEQAELLKKYGLDSNADAIFAKAGEQISARKQATSAMVVPGTPTALKQAAAAAPATPPAAPAPAK